MNYQQRTGKKPRKTWQEMSRREKRVGIGCGILLAVVVCLLTVAIAIASNSNDASQSLPDRLTSDMQSTLLMGSPKLTYAMSTRDADVQDVLDNPIDINTTVFTLKSDCFTIQHNLWTKDASVLHSVKVSLIVPTTNTYGQAGTAVGGYCILTADTARLLNWANLTDETAWKAYDTTFLSQLLQ